MHHFHRRLCTAIVLLILQIASLATATSSAEAHPYGPLQTADVAAQGDQVTVTWHFGATDDISYLAAALKALPAERTLLDGVILYKEGDEDLLTRSPKFAEYLIEHIVVNRDGKPCSGEVQKTVDLIKDGIPVAFSCPSGTGPVSITIDMLFDLHPAYRTLATSADGQRGEYVAEDATHDWNLSLAASGTSSEFSVARLAPIGAACITVLVLIGACWWLQRSSRYRKTDGTVNVRSRMGKG